MKRKHQAKPDSIKSTVLTGLSIICILIGLCLAELAKSAPIVLQQDTRMPNTQCANGLWGLDGCLTGYEYVAPGLIFSENFDDQPDWYSPVSGDGGNRFYTLPDNWDAGVTDEAWHPDNGFAGTQPVMQINGNNPDQVYGGTGKAFIFNGESYDANNFNSDGFIIKDFAPTDELYVKLNIKFQTGFAVNGDNEYWQSKLFRFMHWDAPESGARTPFFSNGYSAPMYIHDWGQNEFGVRHIHAMRCDDQATNYLCTDPVILTAPKAVSGGSFSANYTSEVAALSPQIVDQQNGGFLPSSGTVWHNQVWGDAWHTIEIYAKLNSAAGVQDGVLKYWLDGELLIDMSGVPWIGNGGDINARWNSFSIGGNNFYKFDLVGAPADRERWYAIDNIELWNALPEDLQ